MGLTEVEFDAWELVVIGILEKNHLNPWVLVLQRRELLGDKLSGINQKHQNNSQCTFHGHEAQTDS